MLEKPEGGYGLECFRCIGMEVGSMIKCAPAILKTEDLDVSLGPVKKADLAKLCQRPNATRAPRFVNSRVPRIVTGRRSAR